MSSDNSSRTRTRWDTDALATLTARYPAFRFRHEHASPRGHRYVAQRRNSTDPGLHTLIASDLAEMHAALAADQDRHAAR